MTQLQATPPPKFVSVKHLIDLRLLCDFEIYIDDKKQTLADLCKIGAGGLFHLVKMTNEFVKAKTIYL